MKKKMYFLSMLFHFYLANHSGAQQNFDSFKTICYCNASSPEAVLRLDNNWQIFKLIPRQGISKKALQDKIALNESQLQLLKDWRVIKEKNEIILPDLVMLDSLQSAQLRSRSKQAAAAVYSNTATAVAIFTSKVKAKFDKNVFTLLFSYIIDGIAWEELEKQKAIKSRELNLETPFWNGEFWFIKNERPLDFGTNSHASGKYTLSLMWNSLSWPHLERLYNDNVLRNLFIFLTKDKTTLQDSVVTQLKSYGILNLRGEFAIPIINRQDNDTLALYSQEFTRKFIEQFRLHADTASLMKDFIFNSPSQALIIFYHEFMWDYLNILVENKVVSIPEFMLTGKLSDKKELSANLFIVLKK